MAADSATALNTAPEGDRIRDQAPAAPTLPDADFGPRRAEWHRYYSAKRIRHQNLQLELIGSLPGSEPLQVLEVGPHLGYVTALLANIGHRVTTLDLGARSFAEPPGPHIEMNLEQPDPGRLAGFDLVVCCETLEHLSRPAAEAALAAFRRGGARWLLVSVPYNGVSLFLELHWTAPSWFRSLAYAKWQEALRRYVPEPHPHGHKWELGTRGQSVRGWEAALAAAGWRILDRRFTAPTRSVFHLCEAVDTA